MGKFIKHNAGAKNQRTCDCVIRALVTALSLDIRTVINELTDIYMETGYFINDPKCYDKYLSNKGYIKNKQPRCADNTKYTAEEFCEYLNQHTEINSTVLAHVGSHHITAFVNIGDNTDRDYRVYDTWDCTQKSVGNYWTSISNTNI